MGEIGGGVLDIGTALNYNKLGCTPLPEIPAPSRATQTVLFTGHLPVLTTETFFEQVVEGHDRKSLKKASESDRDCPWNARRQDLGGDTSCGRVGRLLLPSILNVFKLSKYYTRKRDIQLHMASTLR